MLKIDLDFTYLQGKMPHQFWTKYLKKYHSVPTRIMPTSAQENATLTSDAGAISYQAFKHFYEYSNEKLRYRVQYS